MKKLTTEEFIIKSKLIHGNKYDYSDVRYIDSTTKVNIICHKHGIFTQKPNSHLMYRGCPKCKGYLNMLRCSHTDNDFIKKGNFIHNNKYDYTKIKYVNNHIKVNIICPIHGEFEQTPNSHLNNSGCPFCVKNIKTTTDSFITKSKLKHGDKYDYSKVKYYNSKTQVIIGCTKHGVFLQTPTDHLSGCGCPKCKQSKGERNVRMFLEYNNIKYIAEKTFDDCKNTYKLPFDFYLPEKNTLIEYDGTQHFKPEKFYGGDEGFKYRQLNDKIKTDYALANNIKLIRIKYDECIESKLIKLI